MLKNLVEYKNVHQRTLRYKIIIMQTYICAPPIHNASHIKIAVNNLRTSRYQHVHQTENRTL